MSETILAVPYLTQPTNDTCQSTCLKMFGLYLASRLGMSSPVQNMAVGDIWKEINEGTDRPSTDRNSYQNMAWWLGRHFPYRFEVIETRDVDRAIQRIMAKIDKAFPVLVSTNHSRTDGHIILVIGYVGAERNACASVQFVCHDPYGKFNPALGSQLYGPRRYEGGSSLASGGETGPGKAVIYDHDAVRRIRADKHSRGSYFLVSAKL